MSPSANTTPGIRDLLRFTRTHLRHHEALMRATGGHFNLFQILGIGHYEVRTHSPILAELLDPQGRHGQGDVFLRLFLSRLGIDDRPFQASDTRVETERYVGRKTATTGGQIDMVIEDGVRPRVLIENKIHAGDQENQLLRYHNYDKTAVLIYLTLFGHEASEYSAKELRPDEYQRISYEKEIRDWLIDCRKEAACQSGVRETLSQYIALIEDLTHQSTTLQMNEELIKYIIDDGENLKALYNLRDAVSPVQTFLIAKLDKELNEIAGELGLEKMDQVMNLEAKDSTFSFGTACLERNNLRIGFTFGKGDLRDFDLGFVKVDFNKPCPKEDALRAEFKELYVLKQTTTWPAYANFDGNFRHWNHEAFEAIRSGEMAKTLKRHLEILREIAIQVYGDELPADCPS